MKYLTIGTVLIMLAACGQTQPTDQPIERPTTSELHSGSGITLSYMDTNVHPGDDFSAYVNGGWIAEAEIPADKASFGVFTEMNEASQDNIKAIIEDAAAGDFAKGTDEQKVGALYQSFMDLDTRNQLGIKPLTAVFAEIDALRNHDQLAVYFAVGNKINHAMPFVLGQYPDLKNPAQYMIFTWQGGLGLPDREFYLEEGNRAEQIRNEYVKHITTMLTLAGLPNTDAVAKEVFALEERMAAEHMKKEQTRDMFALYNKIPTNELPALMPSFNWDGYLAESGIAGIDAITVSQLDHMKALDEIITSTSIESWKNFLRWSAINASADKLTEAFDNQDFHFYQTVLLGIEEPLPRWRRGVDVVNQNLGEVVGKVYVKRHFPPEAKERMLDLVDNLIEAYEVSITDLEWMTDDTKPEALDKLSKFTAKIGYPDEWKDYSKLDIEPDDFYGNMRRATLIEFERLIERQGRPVDRDEWVMTPQTVNAYYNPAMNEVVFPAAMLQPPFFDMTADDAVNYGAIGAVIGHEIGHGFDDSGSSFDGDGVLRNWWTEDDRAAFEGRTAKLVDQYSEFKPFPDLAVNGEFTLGENIGDLGGFGIALLAYQLSLNEQEAPVLDGFTGIQRVFLGYGQVWRNKYRDEALRNLINTNPHAPSMYRANGVVRNLPEFYDAFGVTENHSLYLAPEDRVKIW